MKMEPIRWPGDGKPLRRLRDTLRTVATSDLILSFWVIAIGVAARSVSLGGLGILLLENGAVALLMVAALNKSADRRRLCARIAIAALATSFCALAWTLWRQYPNPMKPAANWIIILGCFALFMRLIGSMLLISCDTDRSRILRRAAVASNKDLILCAAAAMAGLLVAITDAAAPDMIVGAGIVALEFGSPRAIYNAARLDRGLATRRGSPA